MRRRWRHARSPSAVDYYVKRDGCEIAEPQVLWLAPWKLAVQQVAEDVGQNPQRSEDSHQWPLATYLTQIDIHQRGPGRGRSASTTVVTPSETL